MAFVDDTIYAQNFVPEADLKTLFVQARLGKDWRKIVADADFTTITDFTSLAADADSFETKIKGFIVELAVDNTEAKRAVHRLRAVFADALLVRSENQQLRQKMLADPNKVPEIDDTDRLRARAAYRLAHPDEDISELTEPHPRFVDKLFRDVNVRQNVVNPYAIGDMRLRFETIQMESGFQKSLDKLVEVAQVMKSIRCTSEEEVLRRINAFFIALEYIKVCPNTMLQGPKLYIKKLNEFRSKHEGLYLLIGLDRRIRKEVHEKQLGADQAMSFGDALKEVLLDFGEHAREARAELLETRVSQASSAGREVGSNSGSRNPSWSPTKTVRGDKKELQRKRKADAKTAKGNAWLSESEFKKQKLEKGSGKVGKGGGKQGKAGKGGGKKGGKFNEFVAMPSKEKEQLFKIEANGRCRFWNSSMGCSRPNCTFKHECISCGAGDHRWYQTHFRG